MAQSYFPNRVGSPVKVAFTESVFVGMSGERQSKVEDIQEAYVESKDWCVVLDTVRLHVLIRTQLAFGDQCYQVRVERDSVF